MSVPINADGRTDQKMYAMTVIRRTKYLVSLTGRGKPVNQKCPPAAVTFAVTTDVFAEEVLTGGFVSALTIINTEIAGTVAVAMPTEETVIFAPNVVRSSDEYWLLIDSIC